MLELRLLLVLQPQGPGRREAQPNLGKPADGSHLERKGSISLWNSRSHLTGKFSPSSDLLTPARPTAHLLGQGSSARGRVPVAPAPAPIPRPGQPPAENWQRGKLRRCRHEMAAPDLAVPFRGNPTRRLRGGHGAARASQTRTRIPRTGAAPRTHRDASDSPMAGKLPGAVSSNSSGRRPLRAERRGWDGGRTSGAHLRANPRAELGRLGPISLLGRGLSAVLRAGRAPTRKI